MAWSFKGAAKSARRAFYEDWPSEKRWVIEELSSVPPGLTEAELRDKIAQLVACAGMSAGARQHLEFKLFRLLSDGDFNGARRAIDEAISEVRLRKRWLVRSAAVTVASVALRGPAGWFARGVWAADVAPTLARSFGRAVFHERLEKIEADLMGARWIESRMLVGDFRSALEEYRSLRELAAVNSLAQQFWARALAAVAKHEGEIPTDEFVGDVRALVSEDYEGYDHWIAMSLEALVPRVEPSEAAELTQVRDKVVAEVQARWAWWSPDG